MALLVNITQVNEEHNDQHGITITQTSLALVFEVKTTGRVS